MVSDVVTAPFTGHARRAAAFRYRARHNGFLAVSGLVMRAFHGAMSPHMQRVPRAELQALARRCQALLEEDLQAAEAGVLPGELVHEMPMLDWLRQAPAMLAELPRILVRKHRGAIHDLPPGLRRERYPPYYLRNFHWQSDGWLSERSARLYDAGVEVLFGGTADVMRRSVLPPLLSALRGAPRPAILDVACGTGALLSQLARALPEAQLVGVDLSRPYVEHARARLARQGAEVDLVVDNAESLPWRDERFDAVTCVFLFHELPRDARRHVAAEMFRVLRPGGVLAFLDSAQEHDGEDIVQVLRTFPSVYHEPYYRSFLSDPLGPLLGEAGFVVDSRRDAFVASRIVAHKPYTH
jgi:ubiquinone/menaquinone biosynthesis C-methylase UbiE